MSNKKVVIIKRIAPWGWAVLNIPTAFIFSTSFMLPSLSHEPILDKAAMIIFFALLFFGLFVFMGFLFNLWIRLVRYPLEITVEINADMEDQLEELKNINKNKTGSRLTSLKFRDTRQLNPSESKQTHQNTNPSDHIKNETKLENASVLDREADQE